ncbi:MAG TPA: hypothetical protein VF627_04370, partial [Abditibacterium sp.]
MKSRIFPIGAVALPVALLSGAAHAQAPVQGLPLTPAPAQAKAQAPVLTQARTQAQTPRTVYLFSAAVGRDANTLNAAQSAPWGNGTVENDRRVNYEGAPVLRLTTRNLQEGVRFDLNTPLDLDNYRENGFLRFRLRFQEGGGG